MIPHEVRHEGQLVVFHKQPLPGLVPLEGNFVGAIPQSLVTKEGILVRIWRKCEQLSHIGVTASYKKILLMGGTTKYIGTTDRDIAANRYHRWQTQLTINKYHK